MKMWVGKPVPLCLDHINGNRRDNRLKNLRLLCSNCHAQTSTFAGRNKGKGNYKNCPDCHGSIHRRSTRCRPCANKKRKNYKIEWPALSVLIEEIEGTSMNATAKRLGVTFNTTKRMNGVTG